MQQLLEEEVDADDTRAILKAVLDGYLRFPRPKYLGGDETGSPELSESLRDKIEWVLESSLALHVEPDTDLDQHVVERLEGLLPDPEEDEDAFKSLWDTIIDIHGRESVKLNEHQRRPRWTLSCLVARVLLHYDFLIYGIVNAPLE